MIARMTFSIQDNPVRGSGGQTITITTERSRPTQNSFVVRNRARSRVRLTSPPALSVVRTTSPTPGTTSTRPSLSSLENIKKLSSSALSSSLSSASPHRESRITIPRLKSSSLRKENKVDSEPQLGTKKVPTKPNTKKGNPGTKQKSTKEKRPKQKKEKNEKSERPRAPGCFSICDTLIFEVYQLLGGSVCDC